MKVSELVNRAPKILLVGDVGTGKTALTLTLGEALQVIDIDNGLATGNNLIDKFTSERKKVDVKQFLEPDPTKSATVFPAVKAYIYSLPGAIKRGEYQFKVLAIDSLSSLAEAAIQATMANSSRIGSTPEIQHWGMAFNDIKNVLGVIRSLPIPVILIAHEQVKSVGTGTQKKDTLEIAIQGKNLPSQICRYYGEIWYMETREIAGGKQKYILKTVSDSIFPARSRACLENNIDTSIGMWGLLKKIGYEPTKEIK